MKINAASIEDDRFAQTDRDGKLPQNIVLVWEVARLTPDQASAGIMVGERIWQRMRAHFGNKQDGTPSRFLAFIQSLVAQQLLADGQFTLTDLVGIEQRVIVEEFTKTLGANAGQIGTRISSVEPVTLPRRAVPQTPSNQDELDLPF